MKLLMALLTSALLASPAHSQVFIGKPIAVDGDTLAVGDSRIRLFGVDAVEKAQTCKRGAEEWACGHDAMTLLATLLPNENLSCRQEDVDVYGRTVAVCRAGWTDLGLAMIEGGYAIALPNAPESYQVAEAESRAKRIGIWASQFAMPTDYRALHPRNDAAPSSRPERRDNRTAQIIAPRRVAGGFPNCAAALAAGAAPFYRGQPGYRPDWDGDGDGIACEPHRRR